MKAHKNFRALAGLAGMALALSAQAAKAEDAAAPAAPKEFTVTGSVSVLSDYRLRGVSQTDRGKTLQAGVTVTHKSGFYGSIFSSNLAGWGTFGGPNLEFDLIGGYAKAVGPVTIDAGLTWYMYPDGAAKTDFAEPYVKVSGAVGPVSYLAGVAYAPKQKALGNYSNTPYSHGQAYDNLYLWGDTSYVVPSTKLKLKGHLGYSKGNPGLGPNGTSVAPTGSYFDWQLGGEYPIGPFTFGVSWVDTDISKAKAAYLQPNFSVQNGRLAGQSIAGSTALFSATVSF
ncbi:TorF family putative porin [Novosphingobium sp. 1748]|uniref:TorF family putative porin n=2 Tax=Novosphingobium TaxID=165696 RepID=UPI000A6FF39E|nr:uncharacterized protein (TIGR02001 family) [Novosphingobium sp. 1748]NKJ00765.1 uncharacterized protein (TIGR02001 family) [Novosphingobium sp. SG707]